MPDEKKEIETMERIFREAAKGGQVYENVAYIPPSAVYATPFGEVRAIVMANIADMNDKHFAAFITFMANKGFPGFPVSYPDGSYRYPGSKIPL